MTQIQINRSEDSYLQSESSMNVMIVEDEPVSRRALTLLVNSRGMKAESFESAEDALADLMENEMPSVALVDLELPGMNGMDFIRKLRSMSDHVFPVLMTAANMDIVNRFRRDSDVTFFRKPLDFERLIALIENHS